MSDTALIRSYSGLTRLLSPLLPLWLKRRALKGKEDPARQGERFGQAGLPRPDGQLFWLHGASVGEVTMLLPLIHKILADYPAAHILVTSGTVTSADILQQRLPGRAFHQYVPLDTVKAVTSFLDHWQPDAVLWAESEIWPNLIRLTKARGVPMALINARMSDKSIQGWAKRKSSAKAIFGCFDVILAANDDTANGLSWLLGAEIENAGNLKDTAPKLPVDHAEVVRLKKQIKDRPVWCAASTHAGEEEIILKAHDIIRQTHADALLVLAVRHPERRGEITPMMDDFVLRSTGGAITKSTATYLFDTIGEMGIAYSLSDVTFVCGSLVEGLMGHNPLEAARFSNAILTGAHIESFADSYKDMFAFDAARRILAPNMVGEAVNELLSNPDMLGCYQSRALQFASSRDAVLDHVWAKLDPILPEPS